MSNKAEHRSVPKLRFPEFQSMSGWSESQLKDAVLMQFRKRVKPLTPYKGLGVRSHGKGTFLKHNESPEKNLMEYLYEVHANDLVVNITFAWEGALAIASHEDEGALVSHRFPTYVFKKKVAIPAFFRYMILDKLFIYQLGIISPGGAGRNRVLDKTDFLKLPIRIPIIEEQQKIADCLSSIDELIAAQAQKLDALKTHKKGLMQQLFPTESEALPKLRFPEFRDAPEWEKKPLDIICNINPSSKGLPQFFFYIDLESVVDGKLVSKTKMYRENAPSRAQRLLKNEDVIYQTVRPYQKNNFFVDINDKDDYVASTGYAQLRAYDCSRFLYQVIHTDTFVNKVIAKCTGSNYPAINTSDLAEICVAIPSLPEQQKIADCLFTIDRLIAAQAQKLDALKAHKKGLMQQLFPIFDGVQG